MVLQTGREAVGGSARAGQGWTLARASRPSRLFGANGIRVRNGEIYVAQVAGSQVSAVDPDSGAIRVVSQAGGAITAPDDLVFDEAGNLYCTEITQNRVTVLEPNGTSRVVCGDIQVANPITYHQGRLIAGELRVGARILELDRNGGAPRVILDNIPMVNAFDVGPDGKLYFPVQGLNEIWRISLDGGEPEVVAKDLGVPDSVKFHPDGYIVSTQVGSGQVLKVDPRTGEKSVLADLAPGLDNVAFVGNRTFVSHITGSIHEITAPGQLRPLVEQGLQWPMGLAVGAEGEVLVADGMFSYRLDGAGLAPLAMFFHPGYPGFLRGVAADGPGQWIVATANGTIARWRPAAAENDLLAHGLTMPMGVAAANGAVIAVDGGAGRVIAIDSAGTRDLATGLDQPTGVAVGGDGSVYVSESGAGRVARIAGGHSETVADGLGRPEGIALSGGKLYAVDVAGKQVVEIDLATGSHTAIATGLPVGSPGALPRVPAGGVGDMCGPMTAFTGLAAAADGTIYVSADAEGSVLALRPQA